MSETAEQNVAPTTPIKRKRNVGKIFKIGGSVIALVILLALIVNALIAVSHDYHYIAFGNSRLITVNTDTMDPAIPSGSMIVCVAPDNENQISAGISGEKTGSVITYKVRNADGTMYLLTHRVVSVIKDEAGITRYVTRGDNATANDTVHPAFVDIVGIYTGRKVGFFGALFGFLQSTAGLCVLIFIVIIVINAWLAVWYVRKNNRRRSLERDAIKKGAQALSGVSLRYDNIHEITAVLDVLGMLAEQPRNKDEAADVEKRLRAFIKADNIELPQTPETAAILDSLPAPDTPGSLAAALAAGATLRQAEDGQTLILTTMSGGKTILLTPVHTADGVILCQQGVRIRSDIAPNIEDLGISSMPFNPEFFEGQPLEKAVHYPELPQPMHSFGPEQLSPHASVNSPVPEIMRELLSKPMPVSSVPATAGILPEHAERAEIASPAEKKTAATPKKKSGGTSSAKKTSAAKKSPSTKKPSAAKTEAQKTAAAEKKRKQQEYLDSLSPEEREKYLAEQQLKKERAAAQRKAKREAEAAKKSQTPANK